MFGTVSTLAILDFKGSLLLLISTMTILFTTQEPLQTSNYSDWMELKQERVQFSRLHIQMLELIGSLMKTTIELNLLFLTPNQLLKKCQKSQDHTVENIDMFKML